MSQEILERIISLEHQVREARAEIAALKAAKEERDRESYADLRAQLNQAGSTQQFWGRHVITSIGTLVIGAVLLYVGYLLKK